AGLDDPGDGDPVPDDDPDDDADGDTEGDRVGAGDADAPVDPPAAVGAPCDPQATAASTRAQAGTAPSQRTLFRTDVSSGPSPLGGYRRLDAAGHAQVPFYIEGWWVGAVPMLMNRTAAAMAAGSPRPSSAWAAASAGTVGMPAARRRWNATISGTVSASGTGTTEATTCRVPRARNAADRLISSPPAWVADRPTSQAASTTTSGGRRNCSTSYTVSGPS